jgi:hypothetical protein
VEALRVNGEESVGRVPEVSTMVVVTALLLLTSGGIVMTGTTIWILDMKVSLTKEVTSLVKGQSEQRARRLR